MTIERELIENIESRLGMVRWDIECLLVKLQTKIDQLKEDEPKDAHDLIKKDIEILSLWSLEKQLLGVIERCKVIEENLK
jgi:hypothetical protein